MRLNVRIAMVMLAVAALAVGCATRHPVYPVSESSGKQGVFYSLPYTRLLVSVPTARIDTAPGHLKDLAECFFGPRATSQMIEKAATKYVVDLSKATVEVQQVPDPKATFLVEMTAGPLQRKTLEMQLNEMGLITDAKSEVEDKTFEVAMKVIQTAAAVAKAGVTDAKVAAGLVSRCGALKSAQPGAWAEAERAVARLASIQTARETLLGQPPEHVDKIYLKELLAVLDAEEKDILAAFFGSAKITPWLAQFEIDPGERGSAKGTVNVLKWSSDEGIMLEQGTTPLSKPAFSLLTSSTKPLSTISIEVTEVAGMADTIVKYWTARKKNGFYYRIPGEATVRFLVDNEEQKRQHVAIAQFGTSAALPVSLGSLLKSNYAVGYHPTTGALKSVVSGSEPLTGAQVDQAGAAAQAVVEYRKAKAELERQRQSERQQRFEEWIQAIRGTTPE